MAEKVLFIDRDGTINVDKGYVCTMEAFSFLPGSLEALQQLSSRKVAIYVVTNQAGIARGLYTEEDYHCFTDFFRTLLHQEGVKLADILYCPHHPEGVIPHYTKRCDCRKPATGLLKQVLDQNRYRTEDAAMIGDKNSDIEAGRSLKLRTYLVETGYGYEHKGSTQADFIVPNLKAAVDHLLAEWGMRERKL